MAVTPLTDRPTWLLSRANGRAQRILRSAFQAEGASGYHYRLLAAIDEHGPTSQADLGRRTDIDRSDVTAVVDDLVDRGWVHRSPDPADRRRNTISITRAGRSALRRLDRALDRAQDEVLAPLTDRERATLARLLTKLSDPPA